MSTLRHNQIAGYDVPHIEHLIELHDVVKTYQTAAGDFIALNI
jgi:hypothetical protein